MLILQYFSVAKKSKTGDQLCSSSATLSDPHGPLSYKVPTEAIASAITAVTKSWVTKAKGIVFSTLVIICVARMPRQVRPVLPKYVLEALIKSSISSTFNLSNLGKCKFVNFLTSKFPCVWCRRKMCLPGKCVRGMHLPRKFCPLGQDILSALGPGVFLVIHVTM